MAALSSQSISTPSRLLALTKPPSLLAQSIGSMPAEVGNSVAPKALMRILIPLSLQSFFNFFCTSSLLDPKIEAPPKYFMGSAQMLTMSRGPEVLQKARAMKLQMESLAYPGTPMLPAMASGGHHWLMRSMQVSLTGQSKRALGASTTRQVGVREGRRLNWSARPRRRQYRIKDFIKML